jgi:hypothetical protein
MTLSYVILLPKKLRWLHDHGQSHPPQLALNTVLLFLSIQQVPSRQWPYCHAQPCLASFPQFPGSLTSLIKVLLDLGTHPVISVTAPADFPGPLAGKALALHVESLALRYTLLCSFSAPCLPLLKGPVECRMHC